MKFLSFTSYVFAIAFFIYSTDANAQCPLANSCTPGNGTDFGVGCGIFNVTLNTLNYTTGGVADGYKDYSCTQGTSLIFGVNYNLSVQTGSTYAENVRVWVDYNNNGTLDVVNELVFSSDNKTLHTGILNIPSTAVLNQALRVRIASDYSTAVASPCSTSQYSQTEDYKITVLNNTNSPTANFQSADTLTCIGSVAFQDQSLNGPTSWKWYFGDGDSSSLQNPAHAYTSGGYYSVTLIAKNSSGTNTLTKTNYIHFNTSVPVSATCTPLTSNYCCGYGISNVNFNGINNSSSDASEGYKDFTCKTKTTVKQAKKYAVTITTSGINNQDTKVYIDYNNDGSFNITDELVFQSYNTLSPSGVITIPATVVLNTPLRMRVMSDYAGSAFDACTYLDKGQAEDYTITIMPNTSSPTIYFGVNNTTSCNSNFIFADSSDNGPTSWFWEFGDGATSTLQNPNHTYGGTGNYTVKLKACNSFGCDSLTKSNYINYSTTCGYCTSSGNSYSSDYISYVVLNSITNYTSQSASGYGDYTYVSTSLTQGLKYTLDVYDGTYYGAYYDAWIDYNNDGVFSTSEQILNDYQYYGASADFTVPGTASVGTTRMRVILNANTSSTSCDTGIDGEVEDYTINIVKNTAPPVAHFYSADAVTCISAVAFTDTSENVVTSWLWDFGDGTTTTLQNPTHTYSSYGTYTVKLKTCNSYGCDSVTKSNYIKYSTTCSYCTSTGNNNTYGDYITNVTFGSLNNSSGTDPNGYGDYTSLSAKVLLGNTYNISITSGIYDEYCSVWIDYNQDAVFDISEQVIASASYNGTYSASLTIPSNASPGVTRMRVLISYYSYGANTPCGGNIAYGEVEDYSVHIISNTQPPVPDFTSVNTTTCTGTVNFTNITTGNVTSMVWKFGDGTTSTLSNPVHTYSSYGNYTVELKTCNSYGCDSVTKNNYISYSAVCSYCTAGGISYSSDYITYINLNTINNYTGQSASGYRDYTNFSTNLTQGLNYTLNVYDGTYNYAYYNAWIDYNHDNVFSVSEQILNDYQYNYTSAAFTVPGTSTAGATRMRVILNASNYSASCATGIDGEVEDYTINILQNTAPPVAHFFSANVVTCSPVVAFTDTSSNVVTSWLWNFGDGTTSTLQNPTHTYSSYGTYTVKLETCNSYGCDSVTKNNYISYSTVCPVCSASGSAYSSDYISYVELNTIYNYSGQSASGYGDYTSMSTNISPGIYYSFYVYEGSYNYAYFNAWIDYNHDNIFSASEMIMNDFQFYSASAGFTVPSAAVTGITRMRVIVNSSNYSSSCATGIDGEVEDYTINIVPSYCAVSGNNNASLWIDYVSMAALNNSSNQDPGGYGDYTSLVTLLNPGRTYNMDVEVGPYSYSKVYIVAWLDFNGDGVFDNTSERFSSVLTNQNQNTSLNIAVPSSVKIGFANMRILATTNLSNSTNSCSSNMYYGEIEDYTINFTNVTSIQKPSASTNSLIVTPNPNSGIFDVNINVPDATGLRLQIMNTLGEIVKDDLLPSGNSFARSYDLSGLASGMYYVKLIIGQETVIIKKVITQ